MGQVQLPRPRERGVSQNRRVGWIRLWVGCSGPFSERNLKRRESGKRNWGLKCGKASNNLEHASLSHLDTLGARSSMPPIGGTPFTLLRRSDSLVDEAGARAPASVSGGLGLSRLRRLEAELHKGETFTMRAWPTLQLPVIRPLGNCRSGTLQPAQC